MQPLEFLAKVYAKNIQTEIRRFLLDFDIRVEETVEQRSASAFDHALLFGNYGFNDDEIAILASSKGASYNGRPIQFMIIPPNPDGALLVAQDKSAVAADFFYVIEKDVIKAIHTTEPVELDLLDLRLDLPYGNAARNKIPDYVLATRKKTQDFSDSKADTNVILRKYGILVPKQRIINIPYDFINQEYPTSVTKTEEAFLNDSLDELSLNNFVLKGETGCGGYYVRMFGRHELDKATWYIRWLEENGKKVLLEERIKPLHWKNEDDQYIDWNIRAFTTLEEKPQWIDAIVRYNLLTGSPVNICQHARVEELEKTVERTWASIKRIKNTALKVARGVYTHIKKSGERPTGFLGLDLIVSEQGIYTIEVNSAGSGGFAELLEIRKKPLASVQRLLENMGPLLEHNHAQRTLKQYKRIPNTVEDYLDLAERFKEDQTQEASSMTCELKMYENILTLLKARNDGVSLYKNNAALAKYYDLLIPIYVQTGQYEKAHACYEERKRLELGVKKGIFSEEQDGLGRLLQLGTAYERRK